MSNITTQIKFVIKQLNNDKIVAIPTETVYGLAGNAYSETAIKKIFALKNRPLNHPLIMHIAQNSDITQWVTWIPDYAKTLMNAFWPGPLTIVMMCQPNSVSPLITGGQQTIAIRCPKHPIAQSLLTALEFPLVAPSANPFGKISPTTALHVQHSFKDKSLVILDGGRCTIGIESTIVTAINPAGYQILRHGTISEQAIRNILPNSQLKDSCSIRVPGKLNSHYQPEKPFYCFTEQGLLQQFCQINPDCYVLSFNKNNDFKQYLGYQLPNNPKQLAYELYYQLRYADESPAKKIGMELPPDNEQWAGIRERVLKAAQLLA